MHNIYCVTLSDCILLRIPMCKKLPNTDWHDVTQTLVASHDTYHNAIASHPRIYLDEQEQQQVLKMTYVTYVF